MTPIVIAHRGASSERAEHSIAAYELAIAQGADALECDVRLTADGHLVCVHDATLERTSNGLLSVSTSTLEQLQQFDVTAWHSGDEPEPVGEVHPDRQVLQFQTLLELATSAGRPVGLSVETKHPSRGGSRLESEVVKALKRFGLVPAADLPGDPQSGVRVMSFSPGAMLRMRAEAPTIPTVFLVGSLSHRVARGSLPFGALVSGPGIDVISAWPEVVEQMHAKGKRVHVWTVDTDAQIELCLRLGVDGLITNRPAYVKQQIEKR